MVRAVLVWGWGVRDARAGRGCRWGCSRVEHRHEGLTGWWVLREYGLGFFGVWKVWGLPVVGFVARCWVLRPQAPGGVVVSGWPCIKLLEGPCVVEGSWVCGGFRGWVWWLLENCIVDASIFCFCGFVFVGKFVRAYGGCLGTRSR